MARVERNGAHLRAAWLDESGRRQRRTIGRADELTPARAQRLADAAEAGDAPPDTLGDWCARYLALRAPELSEAAHRNHAATLERFTDAIGAGVRLARITPAACDDWRAGMIAEGLAAATIADHLKRARAALDRARLRGAIDANPLDGLSVRVPPPDRRPADLDEAGVRRLLDAAPSPGWECWLALCALAGLRRSEARRVTLADIGTDRVRVAAGKTGRGRAVPLEPELGRRIWRSVKTYRSRGIWRDLKTYGALVTESDSGCHRKLLRIIGDAGLDPWPQPFQELRRWRARTWKQHHPEWVVDAWMGHSLSVSRKFYLSVPDEQYRAVADAG